MNPDQPNFVHRFVPGKDEVASALLLLHGTGGDEHSLISLGRALSPGAALLSPRGEVLEDGKLRFFRRTEAGAFDTRDLRLRTRKLATFLEHASEKYKIHQRGIFAVGFSSGADTATSLLLRHPGLLRAAILLRPMLSPVSDALPDLSGVPILVSSGRMDPTVAARETERLADLLGGAGASVDLRWYRAGHELQLTEIREVRAWISSRLAS